MKSKLLFIQCPMLPMENSQYSKNIMKRYSKKGVILPPMGMAYLASIMRDKGYPVAIIDGYAENLSKEELIKRIKGENPSFLLFSTSTATFLTVAGWMKILKKEFPDITNILGGSHNLTYPKETLTHKHIDIIVIGDAWETLPDLIKTIENDDDLNNVNGIGFRDNEKIIITPLAKEMKSWENIPFPARDLLPNNLYSTIISTQRPSTIMMTAMGCPFSCAYCDTPIRAVYRKAGNIVDEIEECVARYGIKEINFYDETFTINQQRTFEVCDAIIKKGLNKKMVFTIRTRADCVSEELIKKLDEAGCARINFGVESASEELTKKLKRNLSLDSVRKAVSWTKKTKMQAFGFFMMGFPDETIEDIKKTVNLAIELDFDYVQFTKLTPLPNTQLYFDLRDETGYDYWKEYTLKKIAENESFKVTNCQITHEEIDKMIKYAYNRFYIRPRLIFKRLKNIKSFTEFKELVASAFAVADVG